MKILYGVQATGNGHITRARIMAQALNKAGVDVDWVFSGRKKEELFDMEVFGDYRCFRGLTFAFTKGKVDNWKTMTGNNVFQLWKDIREMDVSGYDLVMNDFEPITAWAARRAKKKTIGLSHQCSFFYDIPKKDFSYTIDKFMRWFAPVELGIGVHWDDFGQPILPPIVEHTSIPVTTEKDQVLFYFPFMSLERNLEVLAPFTHKHFNVYYGVEKTQQHGHITVHPFSRDGFQRHLHSCEGVITAAGFELPSESLMLGKKLLVHPVAGQVEQLSNGLALEQLQLATVAYNGFDQKVLAEWLEKPAASSMTIPNVAEGVVEWLQAGDVDDVESLKQVLWGQVSRPNNQIKDQAAEAVAAV